MPLEYIENLPEGVLNDFIALNTISPYTPEAQAYREGLMTTILYNSNASKKSETKSVTDLFPYLNTDTPEWLEDERVKKAKDLMTSIKCQASLNVDIYNDNLINIKQKIKEEISLERKKQIPDLYVISTLDNLING